jgi:hypothetical protein
VLWFFEKPNPGSSSSLKKLKNPSSGPILQKHKILDPVPIL